MVFANLPGSAAYAVQTQAASGETPVEVFTTELADNGEPDKGRSLSKAGTRVTTGLVFIVGSAWAGNPVKVTIADADVTTAVTRSHHLILDSLLVLENIPSPLSTLVPEFLTIAITPLMNQDVDWSHIVSRPPLH